MGVLGGVILLVRGLCGVRGRGCTCPPSSCPALVPCTAPPCGVGGVEGVLGGWRGAGDALGVVNVVVLVVDARVVKWRSHYI